MSQEGKTSADVPKMDYVLGNASDINVRLERVLSISKKLETKFTAKPKDPPGDKSDSPDRPIEPPINELANHQQESHYLIDIIIKTLENVDSIVGLDNRT